jgi:MoaA/NifB/PqqE/SkfB family radical SAM enzyme
MKDSFCVKPFAELSVLCDGRAVCCCPNWLKEPIGNLNHQSIDEIWNGEQIKKVREGIIDGSYRECKKDVCPFLATGKFSGPREYEKKLRPEYEKGITDLPHGPLTFNFCHDQHCNLACPSCRVNFITGLKPGTVLLHKKIMQDGMHDVRRLILSGDGDPFASKLYREFMQNFTPEQFPNLQTIMILTNGLLWSRKMWDSMPAIHPYIGCSSISVDGATKETYEENRKGGKWEVLLKRLDFVATLGIPISIGVVIQDNNFREIPLFIRLAKDRGFSIHFNKVVDCDTWPKDEFARRAVSEKSHPNHEELKEVIQANREPRVSYGNLEAIFNG